MNKSIDDFRDRAAQWLADHDPRGLEFFWAGLGLINGVQSLGRAPNGATLSPFLNTALLNLSREPMLWNIILICSSVLQFAALAYGTRKNCYFCRIAIFGVSMALWWLVVAAIITGGQPFLVSVRYIWIAIGSLFIFLVLLVKSRVAQHHEPATEVPLEAVTQ